MSADYPVRPHPRESDSRRTLSGEPGASQFSIALLVGLVSVPNGSELLWALNELALEQVRKVIVVRHHLGIPAISDHFRALGPLGEYRVLARAAEECGNTAEPKVGVALGGG